MDEKEYQMPQLDKWDSCGTHSSRKRYAPPIDLEVPPVPPKPLVQEPPGRTKRRKLISATEEISQQKKPSVSTGNTVDPKEREKPLEDNVSVPIGAKQDPKGIPLKSPPKVDSTTCEQENLGLITTIKITEAFKALQDYGSDEEEVDELKKTTFSLSTYMIPDEELEALGDKLLAIEIPPIQWPTESEDIDDIAALFSFDNIPPEDLLPPAPASPVPPPVQEKDTVDNLNLPIEDMEEFSFDSGSAAVKNVGSQMQPAVKVPKEIKQSPNRSRYTKKQKEDLASIGVFKDPSKLSFPQLARNETLKAGLFLINRIQRKELCPDVLAKQWGMPEVKLEGSDSINRSTSPTSLCTDTRKSIEMETSEPIQLHIKQRRTKQKGKRKKIQDFDEESEDPNNHDTMVAIPLLEEVYHRFAKNEKALYDYEPKGDAYDLSQGSMCMAKVIDDYIIKSRTYKIRSHEVVEMSKPENLPKLLKRIKSPMVNLYHGKVQSNRMTLWNEYIPVAHKFGSRDTQARLGRVKRYITGPFRPEQTKKVMEWIEDHFDADAKARYGIHKRIFLTYVLFPEALIRLYAIVNNLCYEQAELEMESGAAGMKL